MSRFRSGIFWASFLLGWLVTLLVLATLIAKLGSDDMSEAEGWAVVTAQQVLSLAVGYAYGRRQFEKLKSKGRGFDVVTKQ